MTIIDLAPSKPRFAKLLAHLGLSGADPYAGYANVADIKYRTADGVPYADLWREFDDTLTLWNEHRAGVAALFSYPVLSYKESVPSVGAGKFFRATEYGIPPAVKQDVGVYQLAYGYEDWDARVAYTWKFLRENPAEVIRARHGRQLEAHSLTVYYEIMKAIFDNRSRTTEIEGLGYNVYPLYNGSGPKPPDYGGRTFASDHSHYVVSGAIKIDSEDVEDCARLLTEHGYGFASQTRIVALANQAEIDEVRKFRTNVVNNNSKTALYDWIPAQNQPAMFTPSADGLLGTQPPDFWNGLRIQGSYADIWWVDEAAIPAGYVLFIATGGPSSGANIVGVREHDNPAWRGLRLMPGNQSNYPLIDGFYQFGMGTGVRQRGGAVVLQVKASGSYDIPAAFTHETL